MALNTFVKNIERINRINQLVKMEATGTPNHLAQTLSISERQVYELINIIKNYFNAPIKYNRQKQSYIYQTKGEIVQKWVGN